MGSCHGKTSAGLLTPFTPDKKKRTGKTPVLFVLC
jgi:hypothetical protein